jgi:hypothetical protein
LVRGDNTSRIGSAPRPEPDNGNAIRRDQTGGEQPDVGVRRPGGNADTHRQGVASAAGSGTRTGGVLWSLVHAFSARTTTAYKIGAPMMPT